LFLWMLLFDRSVRGFSFGWFFGFNSCFCGCCSSTNGYRYIGIIEFSLVSILVFVDVALRLRCLCQTDRGVLVSILVFVDVALRLILVKNFQ